MSRSFTVDSVYRSGKKIDFTGGRYLSDTPIMAAKKAFSKIYSDMSHCGKATLEIHLKETTKNSQNKIYKYKVSKVRKITEVTRGDVIVTYKFTTKAKSL